MKEIYKRILYLFWGGIIISNSSWGMDGTLLAQSEDLHDLSKGTSSKATCHKVAHNFDKEEDVKFSLLSNGVSHSKKATNKQESKGTSHDAHLAHTSIPPYVWLDDEVIGIADLKAATDALINKEGNWLGDKKACPRMVKYLHPISKADLSEIQKWLKIKGIEYFSIASKVKSADVDLVSSWREAVESSEALSSGEIHKLIYLNLASTIHKVNFNDGEFPEQWLKNHQEFHRWNARYKD